MSAHSGLTRPESSAQSLDFDAFMMSSITTSLEAFAKSKPSWDVIVDLSESIVERFVATTNSLSKLRNKPNDTRDRQYENQVLRNRDELLYVEMCHAMNTGDIGRVEASFLPWIYIFKATGKHKYATHLLQFEHDLEHKFSSELSRIIRMNWLINPTGKPGCWRGVDWVVERNNLYTKVIHAGGSSNKTIQHVIKESPLIELYRECHVNVENGFHLDHRTIRHAPPDMTRTLWSLRTRMEKQKIHEIQRGRASNHCVPDQVAQAMKIMQMRKAEVVQETVEEVEEVEAGDLADD